MNTKSTKEISSPSYLDDNSCRCTRHKTSNVNNEALVCYLLQCDPQPSGCRGILCTAGFRPPRYVQADRCCQQPMTMSLFVMTGRKEIKFATHVVPSQMISGAQPNARQVIKRPFIEQERQQPQRGQPASQHVQGAR